MRLFFTFTVVGQEAECGQSWRFPAALSSLAFMDREWPCPWPLGGLLGGIKIREVTGSEIFHQVTSGIPRP